MSRNRTQQIAILVVALTLGACGVTRQSVTLTPVGLSRVPASALPADVRKGSDALRIDFTSTPELLSEEGYVMDEARFCDDAASLQIANQTLAPFLGNDSIRHPSRRAKLSLERVSGPNASVRPVYSTYVFVAQPAYPARDQMPARPAYDLAREPQAICLSLNLREGYELARTTNTLRFSTEQVAGALR